MSDTSQEKNLQHQLSFDEIHSKYDSMDAVELKKLERQAVKRMDIVILPMITMFYLLSFLDRSNIGNARVAGLQKDLGMTDSQYSIYHTSVLSSPPIFFLRKIGPRFLMPSLLTLWGLMVALQGLVTSFAGLVVVRAFLGLVEGPMFPGIVLYLSSFYTRDELAFRVAIFFSSASLSGAFSGLLAAAIINMDGLAGRPGWAWIFILEGIFSSLMGILGFFLIPSSPEELKFSTPAMRELLVRRLAKDKPSSSTNQDHFSFKEVFRSLKSPHVLLVFALFYMEGTILYGQALFLPSIVGELGFNPDKTQLLSVGPFAGGFFVTLGIALWSDRMKSRSIATAVVICLSIAGFAIYLGSDNKFTRYGSLFLTVPGVYASVPPVAAWMSNNSEPHYRRATSIAIGFVATNAGGITSTWLFPTKDSPNYTRTTIINLTFSILIVVLSGVNALLLNYMNQQKVKRRDEILAPYNLDSDDEKGTNATRALVELGDRHPDFKYTL
ncbi:major facilitator superfamily domain-containing protein [Rhodocollybia butyracea]|uniref:Major facilitator superfamily domain-containing protein n=1 Tax=Rhodocollybia butyracea TaxID=206335 RepID=A0A9P5PPW9_9AGAR|nr:major facilitator superfamily domain-containing protein [Rhodocollybia butyracea]